MFVHTVEAHNFLHCSNMPCTAVQALDANMCADAALWGASTCLSLAAFVISAVHLHKYGQGQTGTHLIHNIAASDAHALQVEQSCPER